MKFKPLSLMTLLAGALLGSLGAQPGPVLAFDPLGNKTAPLPAWALEGAVYEVNLRNHSPEGTLKALERDLDRLKALGVKTLWLHPFQPQSLVKRKGTHGSPFSQRDLRGVDPAYGTLEDLQSLVSSLHRRGMKVILDIVLNHTGWDHPWIQAHPEYYEKDSAGQIKPPIPDWADVAKLNYRSEGLRKEILEVLKYWVKDRDFDGFRLDAAGGIPEDFWNWALPQVYAQKPIMILPEWGDEPPYAPFNVVYIWNLNPGEFWNPQNPVSEIFDMTQGNLALSEGVPHLQLLTNHNLMARGTPFDAFGGIPGSQAAAVLFYSLPGVPYLYAGQEVGSRVPADTVNRNVILTWDKNPELQKFYGKYFELRSRQPALQRGSLQVFPLEKFPQVAAFVRQWENQEVRVVVNRSGSPVVIPCPEAWQASPGVDLWTQKPMEKTKTLSLGPWGFLLMKK